MRDSWKTLKLPLSPTARQITPQNYFSSTSRSTSRGRGVRVSTPTPRPQSGSSSRPATAGQHVYTNIQGVPQEQLRRIYLAKCADLSIPENINQECRFYKYCEKNLVNRQFKIKEQELGLNSAKVIGEILQKNQGFYSIDLSTNHISDVGLVVLSDFLSKNDSLIHIDISSNDLTSEGLRKFIEKFVESSSLISLDISSYNGLNRNRLGPSGSETLCSLLKFSPVLSFLELNELGITDSGLEWLIIGLQNNKVLLKLGLSGNGITSKHMEEFCTVVSLSNLIDLNLSSNKIGDDGCKGIANLLVGNENVSNIIKLDLSKNEITFKGSDSIFLALRYNSKLTHLNFENNPLGPPSGQSLHFFLYHNFTVIWFNLNNCALKNLGISHLSLGLAKNKALCTLILSNNLCKDLGLTSIIEALSENKTLINLDLSYNLIQDATGLASTLKENSRIENLNLKENKIKEFCGPILAEISKTKLNLLRMNLDGNHISVKHLEEIKSNLKKNEENYYRNKTPSIRKEIQKLQSGFKDLGAIYDEINRKKHEKVVILNKVQKLKTTVDGIKNAKDTRLVELQEEYKVCRQKSLFLSIELDKLTLEIPKFKIFEDKSVREKEDQIGNIVAETKKLEKLRTQKKEEFAMKRSTLNLVISQLQEELKQEEYNRQSSEKNLNALNKKMLLIKSDLDSLKYTESFYEEKKNSSPQPFVRPKRKGYLQAVRLERSRSAANRKLFVFSPRP